jgi:hypothetical protein
MGSNDELREDRCLRAQLHLDRIFGKALEKSHTALDRTFGLNAGEIRETVGLSAIKLAVDTYTSYLDFPEEQRNALIVHINFLIRGASEFTLDRLHALEAVDTNDV